ncbi:hypothetical protein [Flagellimonas lutimaris]|nr:hypothetical protein [Allomuricauda lutimaris]
MDQTAKASDKGIVGSMGMQLEGNVEKSGYRTKGFQSELEIDILTILPGNNMLIKKHQTPLYPINET